MKAGDRFAKTEQPGLPLQGEFVPEKEILKRRVLEEELRGYRAKCELLMEYMNEAIRVIQKLAGQVQKAPRVEMMGKAMVAGLAHDLRNPMAVIQSCTQSSLEAGDLAPDLRKNLEMIRESGLKANSLLKQFLDFVKSGLNRQATDMHELLIRAWEAACLDTKPAQVKLEMRFSPALPPVLADPDKLERVFINLFLNALRAVAPGGRVIVQTRFLAPENCMEVAVIDDGPGIPIFDRNRVFEPFFSTRKDGVGLGLFLCKSFVEDHQGEISLDSGEGGGTRVTVRLPLGRENHAVPGGMNP